MNKDNFLIFKVETKTNDININNGFEAYYQSFAETYISDVHVYFEELSDNHVIYIITKNVDAIKFLSSNDYSKTVSYEDVFDKKLQGIYGHQDFKKFFDTK